MHVSAPASEPPPQPRRRSLRELTCLVFDDDRRASLRRVRFVKSLRQVAANGGAHFAPAVVERVEWAELERCQQDRKLAALKDLGPAGLRAEIRLAEHLIDKSRATGNDAWRHSTVECDLARRELISRPPDPARPKGGRKSCKRLPDLPSLGEREQARLWATAEAGLAELRAE
jgi:hypothetical protein